MSWAFSLELLTTRNSYVIYCFFFVFHLFFSCLHMHWIKRWGVATPMDATNAIFWISCDDFFFFFVWFLREIFPAEIAPV